MQNSPFEPARLTPGRQALRCASLLLGTSLLHAAPAWAANECGVPPPAGGTVTCTAGEYPGGIDYAAPADLEILLDPGVVTRSESTIVSAGDLRLIGPIDTGLNANLMAGGDRALDILGSGTVYTELDDLIGADLGAAEIEGVGSVTFIADSIQSTSADFDTDTALVIRQTAALPGDPDSGVLARVNSISVTGDSPRGLSVSAESGVARVEVGSISAIGDYVAGLTVNGPVVSIDVGSVTTSGTFIAPAISAFGQTISINVDSIRIASGSGDGIFAAGSGAITVVAGDIVTLGNFEGGIDVSGGNGDVAVTSGTIATSGSNSGGIVATSTSGKISVASGRITTLGQGFSSGIFASSQSGDVSVTSDLLQVSGNSTASTLVGINADFDQRQCLHRQRHCVDGRNDQPRRLRKQLQQTGDRDRRRYPHAGQFRQRHSCPQQQRQRQREQWLRLHRRAERHRDHGLGEQQRDGLLDRRREPDEHARAEFRRDQRAELRSYVRHQQQRHHRRRRQRRHRGEHGPGRPRHPQRRRFYDRPPLARHQGQQRGRRHSNLQRHRGDHRRGQHRHPRNR